VNFQVRCKIAIVRGCGPKRLIIHLFKRLDDKRAVEVGEQKIHEAVGLGRPLKLLALSLSSTLVGGGGGKRGINRLKTPLNHKRAHIHTYIHTLL